MERVYTFTTRQDYQFIQVCEELQKFIRDSSGNRITYDITDNGKGDFLYEFRYKDEIKYNRESFIIVIHPSLHPIYNEYLYLPLTVFAETASQKSKITRFISDNILEIIDKNKDINLRVTYFESDEEHLRKQVELTNSDDFYIFCNNRQCIVEVVKKEKPTFSMDEEEIDLPF